MLFWAVLAVLAFWAELALLSLIDPQETEISTSNVTNITSGMNLNTTNVTVSSNASDLF